MKVFSMYKRPWNEVEERLAWGREICNNDRNPVEYNPVFNMITIRDPEIEMMYTLRWGVK